MGKGYHRGKGERNTMMRRSAGPIWQNKKQMADLSLNLEEEAKSAYEKGTRRAPTPEIRTLLDIRHRVDEPMYINLVDNTFHCWRLYFNSQKNICYVTHLDKRTQLLRVSVMYTKIGRAKEVYLRQQIIWSHTKKITI